MRFHGALQLIFLSFLIAYFMSVIDIFHLIHLIQNFLPVIFHHGGVGVRGDSVVTDARKTI